MHEVFGALRKRGAVKVVVHAADTMPVSKIEDADLEAFDTTIAVNLRSTYIVQGQAVCAMRAGGHIIALSSSVVAKTFPGYGPYIASKAGVEGLVRVLANEVRGGRFVSMPSHLDPWIHPYSPRANPSSRSSS